MAKISELPIGAKLYTPLGHKVLAVLSHRVDGWAVYVGAVPGENHSEEWEAVAAMGDKQNETVARAIVTSLFHPGFVIDRPYAE